MIDKSMDLAGLHDKLFRPMNHFQANVMRPLSPHTASLFESAQIKHEQMDNEKNDSGLVSGCESHSSSLDSNTSQESHHSYDHFFLNGFFPQAKSNRPLVYPQSMLGPPPTFKINVFNQNPLTPPDSTSSDRVTPKSDHEDAEMENTLVMPSPPRENNDDNQNHIKSLEKSVKQNLYITNEDVMNTSSNNIDNSEDCDKSLRVPKVNSHGKVRTFKCKYCKNDFLCKDDLWGHLKVHIPKDKQLHCTYECSFVTEFKHHLEYHLRKHTGSKPFRCDKCDYTCSTKSMLTSHKKSHTNIYQYTCKDCQYASKYCHAFKVHLRRYKHDPNVPLDENGKPAPDIVIDVYGKRRGPRMKKPQEPKSDQSLASAEPFDIGKLLQVGQPLTHVPPVYHPNPANFQFMQGLLQIRALAAAAAAASASRPIVPEPQEEVLDLSRSGCGSFEGPPNKRVRGSAFPLWTADEGEKEAFRNANTSPARSADFDEERTCTTMFSNVEAVVQAPESPRKESSVEIEKKCHHCNMSFGDEALYHIHMTYHGSPDPFTCNMCKEECKDKVAFSLHIIRVAH